MAKRLLLISYCVPPNAAVPSKRIALFARHLLPMGWRATVLGAHPRYAEVLDESLVRRIPRRCPIVYTSSYEPLRSRFVHHHSSRGTPAWVALSLRKLFTYAYPVREPQWGWNRFALKRARYLLGTGAFSMVVVSVPPFSSLLIAEALKKEFGIKVVVDYRDPWHRVWEGKVVPFRESGPWPWWIRRQIRMEDRVLACVDGVIAASSRSAGQFRERLRSKRRIPVETVTNAFDPEWIAPIPRRTFDRFTVVHGGSFHGPRIEGLQLLEVLGKLVRGNRVARDACRVLFFPGTLPDYHKERRLRRIQARYPELDGMVRLMPYLGYESYMSYVKGADLLFLATGAMQEMILAKFYDYLGAERPILALGDPDSAMAEILHSTRAGLLLPYQDARALERILLRLFQEGVGIFPDRDSYAVFHYTARWTVCRLARFLDRVLESP